MLDLVIAGIISLASTCDASSAAAGGCGCGASGASFTICASKTSTQKNTQPIPAATQPATAKQVSKPKSNSSPKAITPAKAKPVTNPTTCQEIWNVGKSPSGCSKPKPPKPASVKKKPVVPKKPAPASFEIEAVENVEDQASALAPVPVAVWSPGGSLVVGATAFFEVITSEQLANLELFGEPASIRFVPISASWLVAGSELSGFRISRSFDAPGEYQAQAVVSYRVDYQLPGEAWVIGAAEISMSSNTLLISVVDPPRRTLLVG